MTGRELKEFFKEHLVPSKLYKIGGKSSNKICMEKTNNGWDVFFSEHHDKIGLMHFRDEASACLSMKNEIGKLMRTMYGISWN